MAYTENRPNIHNYLFDSNHGLVETIAIRIMNEQITYPKLNVFEIALIVIRRVHAF